MKVYVKHDEYNTYIVLTVGNWVSLAIRQDMDEIIDTED